MLGQIGNFAKNNLANLGRVGITGVVCGAQDAPIQTMGRLWKKHPVVASGISAGAVGLSLAAKGNDNLAKVAGLATIPAYYAMSKWNNAFDAKKAPPKGLLERTGKAGDTAIKAVGNAAKGVTNTVKSNPLASAFVAGIAAISLGSYMMNKDKDKK